MKAAYPMDALPFAAPITSGSHRKNSRQSSMDAARSMSGKVLTEQQTLVLRRLSWVADANAYEVSQALAGRVQQNVVARRFDDLESMGLAERTGVSRKGGSNRGCEVWRATREGLRWLQGIVDVSVSQERL